MTDHPIAVLVGAAGVLIAGAVAALNPSSTFAFIWQFVVGFGFVGATLAYWRKRRDLDFEEYKLVYRWSLVGLVVGIGAALYAAVVS